MKLRHIEIVNFRGFAMPFEELAPAMTIEEIDERDGNRGIRGWLSKLAEMANG